MKNILLSLVLVFLLVANFFLVSAITVEDEISVSVGNTTSAADQSSFILARVYSPESITYRTSNIPLKVSTFSSVSWSYSLNNAIRTPISGNTAIKAREGDNTIIVWGINTQSGKEDSLTLDFNVDTSKDTDDDKDKPCKKTKPNVIEDSVVSDWKCTNNQLTKTFVIDGETITEYGAVCGLTENEVILPSTTQNQKGTITWYLLIDILLFVGCIIILLMVLALGK